MHWEAGTLFGLPLHSSFLLKEPSETVTVYVGNLSWTVTDEVLFDFLASRTRGVVSCKVSRNHSGQSKGFALATFADDACARRAIGLCHDTEMGGRTLVVRADLAPERRPRVAKPKRSPETAACDRVFCGNVPFATTPLEFERIFAGAGAAEATLTVDCDGQSRGYGLVRFGSAEDAARAIDAFDGFEIDGRPMRCKFDARAPRRSM